MTTPEESNHGLITTGASGLIRQMDQRLELVNRLLNEIQINTSNCIDVDKALRYLKNPNSIDISCATRIDDDAAEILSRCKEVLCLKSINILSNKAAEALSSHQGGALLLVGLTDISCNNAVSLSKYQGLVLAFGLKTISIEAALALSEYRGILGLEVLTTLSDAAAEIFSRFKGQGIILPKLKSISDESALALSRYSGIISLNGITSLSDVAAQAFSNHRGALNLDGLTCLSDTAAILLSQHQGSVSLKGLKSISEVAKTALSQHLNIPKQV